MLSHEQLDVYDCAKEFLAIALTTVDDVPTGYTNLRNQLRRSAISVPLNIAEGAGKHTQADSAKFYAISRGSALECAAVFDALHILDAISPDTFDRAKHLLTRIVSMLTKMCNRHNQT
jgi:four helix bundle protein